MLRQCSERLIWIKRWQCRREDCFVRHPCAYGHQFPEKSLEDVGGSL
jgi:hypothetical protein